MNLIVVFATLSSLIGYFLDSQPGLEDYFNMTDSDVSNLTRHDSKFSEPLSWIFAIFAFIPFIGISIKVPISAINDLFKKNSHAQENTQPELQKLQKIIFYPALILLALFGVASSSPSIELNYKFLSSLDTDILLVLNVLTVSSVAVFNPKDAAFVLKKGLFKCQACKGGESKTYQNQQKLIQLVTLDESKFRHLIQVGV
jgi:amino acid permease